MKKLLLLFITLITFSFSSTEQPTDCCAVGKYNKYLGYGKNLVYTEYVNSSNKDYYMSVADSQYVSTCSMKYEWTESVDGSLITIRLYGSQYGCEVCTTPDSPFPEDDVNSTYPSYWSQNDSNAPTKASQCTADNGIVESATLNCSVQKRCKVKNPSTAPCENPALVRDSNGSCGCQESSQEFNVDYNTCLYPPNSNCPTVLPPTSIYDKNKRECHRFFYDCIETLHDQTITKDVDSCNVAPPLGTDTDGDGIPDVDDPDIDNDGIPNAEDPDVDGDGIPNADDPDFTGTEHPDMGTDICTMRDKNSHKGDNACVCNTGFIIQNGICTMSTDPLNQNPCSYPSSNSGFDFQGLTSSRDMCIYEYGNMSNNGTGITAKLDACEKFGCYYNTGLNYGDSNVSDTAVDNGSGGLMDGSGASGSEIQNDFDPDFNFYDGLLKDGQDAATKAAKDGLASAQGSFLSIHTVTIPSSSSGGCGCVDEVITATVNGHSFNKTIGACQYIEMVFIAVSYLLWILVSYSLLIRVKEIV